MFFMCHVLLMYLEKDISLLQLLLLFFFDNFFFVKMRAGGKYIKSPVSLPDITLQLKSLSLDQNRA